MAFAEGTIYPEAYCPPRFAHVWDWFAEDFWKGYASNGYSAIPISYSEIAAWAGLKRRNVSPYEAKLLRDICLEYRISSDRKRPRHKEKGVISEIPITSSKGLRALMGDLNSKWKKNKEREAALEAGAKPK